MNASAKWRSSLDKVAFVILAVILFDCAAFGGGTIVEVFGLDFRMAAFLLFGVVSVPLMVLHFRELVKNKLLWAILAWGVWFVFATVNGVRKGHSLDLIVSSWIGFASFGLLPGALCVLQDKKRIILLMKVTIAASIVLAAETLFVLIAYQVLPWDAFDELNLFILYQELGGCTAVDDTIIRIFMRSHPLMIVSCAFCVYFATRKEAKGGWFYCLTIALNLFSIMLSYTRSVYFGVLVAVAAIVICYTFFADKTTKRKFYKVIAKSCALFMAMLLTCDILLQGLFLSYGIYRTVGIDVGAKIYSVMGRIQKEDAATAQPEEVLTEQATEAPAEEEVPAESEIPAEEEVPVESEAQANADQQAAMLDAVNLRSDNIRKATQDELFEKIRQKPLLGHGVGAKLDVRPAGDNEYFFLDIVFKMGLIGLVLYILPVLMMAVYALRGAITRKAAIGAECISWLIGLLGIIGFSWFNPYLGGTNGVVVYCLTICAFSLYMDSQKKQAS